VNVDVARFDPAMATTALTVKLAARPVATASGPPSWRATRAVRSIAGRVRDGTQRRYAWDGKSISLDDIDARASPEAARATGRGTLRSTAPQPVGRAHFADVDLSSVPIVAPVHAACPARWPPGGGAAPGRARGFTQADMALSFAANVEGRRVAVERFRAQTGGGNSPAAAASSSTARVPFSVMRAPRVSIPHVSPRFRPATRRHDQPPSGTLAPAFDVTAAWC